MTQPPGATEPRGIRHPRHLVCPRCRAAVGRPCSFAGRVQADLHCTERLLALGNPDLRARPRSGLPAQQPNPQKTRPAPGAPKKKRRPLPSGPAVPLASSRGNADQQPPLTLFG